MASEGKCYTDTWNFLLSGSPRFPQTKLSTPDYIQVVHGTVIGGNKRRISHAWVELGSGPFHWVWESQLDKLFDKDKYYSETSAKVSYILSREELLKLSFHYKNLGPFSKAELRFLNK